MGLCEVYDYKTELFNFTAECISDEATLFFITKNDFSLMLSREPYLYDDILSIIEYKVQFIAGKLRSFSEQTLKLFERNNKKIKTNSTSNIYDNINLNNKSNIKLNTNKLNSIFNSSKINNNSSFSKKSNFYTMRSLIIKNNSNKTNKMTLYKKNNDSNNNSDNDHPLYKTLNSRRANSYFQKNECIGFNSLNNKHCEKQLISNKYNSIIDKKIPNIFNSTHPKIINNDKLFKRYKTNNLININNNSHITIQTNNIFNEIVVNPKYEVKNNKFDIIKLFPILKNRFSYNNKIKNQKVIYG